MERSFIKGTGGLFVRLLFVCVLTAGVTSCVAVDKEVKLVPEEAARQAALKALRGGEYRATLRPGIFKGETAEAYRIARDVPELIDSINCYCGCQKKHKHKSLLTCYIDRHASKCKICREQALRAYELHMKGEDNFSIRKAIDEEFGRD